MHNNTWNKEKNTICNSTWWSNTGNFKISKFVFWEWVLYLNHTCLFLDSKERSRYFCLTYLIFDNQTKQVVSVSIDHPYSPNNRVKWDATTLETTNRPHTRLVEPITLWHSTPSDEDIMDNYNHYMDKILPPFTHCDADITNPDHFFELNTEQIKKWNQIYEIPDVQLSPPSFAQMIILT